MTAAATMLRTLREQSARYKQRLSIGEVEVLLQIAAGVDNHGDLRAVTDLCSEDIRRYVLDLMTWDPPLVFWRKHPHKRGPHARQFLLTEAGAEMVQGVIDAA